MNTTISSIARITLANGANTLFLNPELANGFYISCPGDNAQPVYFGTDATGIPVPQTDDLSRAVLVTKALATKGVALFAPTSGLKVDVIPG